MFGDALWTGLSMIFVGVMLIFAGSSTLLKVLGGVLILCSITLHFRRGKRCFYCGTQVEKDAKVCPNCGMEFKNKDKK